MDPGSYRERQGYYSSDRDPQQPDIRHHHQQQQQQHQLSQQQLQQLHYAHQLPHHQGLIPPHLEQHQLHPSQGTFMLDQAHAELQRGRDEYATRHTGPAVLQQLIPGTGQVITSPLHRSHATQFSDLSHSQLGQINPASQGSYGAPQSSSDQTGSSMIDVITNSQPYISPDSPTPLGSPSRASPPDDEGAIVTEEDGMESRDQGTVSQPEVLETPPPPSTSITEVDIPKKRAVRLALAETQNSIMRKFSSSSVPIIPDIWRPHLPIGLSFKYSPDGKKIIGVRSERSLQKGARFGPFNGKLVDEAVGSLKDSTWEICLRGKVFMYVDGQSRMYNNWMAFVECANTEDQQNMEAFQAYGDVYFRATMVIEPGSDLKVFYSEEYAHHVGFSAKLGDVLKTETGGFSCNICEEPQPSAKRLLRHLRFNHGPDRSNEMKPVLTWEPRFSLENTENEEPVKTEGVVSPAKSSPPAIKPAKPARSAKLPMPERIVLPPPRVDMVDERFICTTCGKNFPTRGRLAAHETFHEYTLEQPCQICGELQPNSNTLAKHMVTHKAKPFKCENCGNAFATKGMLRRHERLSHTFNHSCRVCGVQFVKKREKNKHEKTHPEWKNFKAIPSGSVKKKRRGKVKQSPRQDEEEAEYLMEVEVDDVGVQEEEVETNPSLPKDMLGKRINHYERPRPFKCNFCPKRYLSRKVQLDHESERHTKRCRFRCSHCPSVFATEIRYIEHVKRHMENRPFQCQHCPNAFASESALRNHQGEHTGLKPIKCDICGKGFRTRHFMSAHKRRMHKVQQMRFVCSFCNKPFADKGNLVKHERRHKGIRPYVCLDCGLGFTSNYCLKSHYYVHTKEKNFGCPHCNQKFTLNQHLTNHIYKEHTSNGAKNMTPQESSAHAAIEEQPLIASKDL